MYNELSKPDRGKRSGRRWQNERGSRDGIHSRELPVKGFV